MAGMNRQTGRWVGGWDHTSQSLGDILSTPLETRVMRRPYGASEDALVDSPQSKKGLTAPVMAVAIPVNRWEPRVELHRVTISSASVTGRLGLDLACIYRPRALFGDFTPQSLMMSGIQA